MKRLKNKFFSQILIIAIFIFLSQSLSWSYHSESCVLRVLAAKEKADDRMRRFQEKTHLRLITLLAVYFDENRISLNDQPRALAILEHARFRLVAYLERTINLLLRNQELPQPYELHDELITNEQLEVLYQSLRRMAISIVREELDGESALRKMMQPQFLEDPEDRTASPALVNYVVNFGFGRTVSHLNSVEFLEEIAERFPIAPTHRLEIISLRVLPAIAELARVERTTPEELLGNCLRAVGQTKVDPATQSARMIILGERDPRTGITVVSDPSATGLKIDDRGDLNQLLFLQENPYLLLEHGERRSIDSMIAANRLADSEEARNILTRAMRGLVSYEAAEAAIKELSPPPAAPLHHLLQKIVLFGV